MSATAIACVHEEVLDYLGRRHLGYCRKCGRTMQYDPTGAQKPRDVTAEFDGNCPFPSPFERSDTATPIEGQVRVQGQAEQPKPESVTTTTESHTTVKHRYIMEHLDEILADAPRLGKGETCRKWGISANTWYRLTTERVYSRVKGADRADRGKDISVAVGAQETREEPILVQGVVSSPGDKRANWAKGRHWKAHMDEICQDVEAIGPDATREKWGMGETWLYHHGLLGRKATREPAVAPTAEASAPAAAPTTQTGGDGHRLPLWNEDWDPAVQVEWLRAWTVVECTKVLREEAAT